MTTAREPLALSLGAPELPDDAGSATVLVAFWMSVLALLGMAGAVGASTLAVRNSVAAAADLGALAGASGVLASAEVPCARAEQVVRANGASMASCRLLGSEVWVEARSPVPAGVAWLLPGSRSTISARAHAELVPDVSLG